jgi:DNA-binding transcriptional MerR regulator/predicted transcriptional regulator YdeE
MFIIGDFARHGQVSVRMLRHYDAIGLLTPARIDANSGYRYYEMSQLARLNRIIALKDLGFSLDQVAELLDEQISADQLHGMLRLRSAQLQDTIATDSARLVQVEARLQIIESEGHMPAHDVIVKPLPALRVVELTASAASFTPEDIGPVVKPLCAELGRRLATAQVTATGPLTCYYEKSEDADSAVIVHAAVPIAGSVGDTGDLRVVDLPAAPAAATTVHRGRMDRVLPAWQAIAQWIDTNAYTSAGYPREVYLEVPEDEAAWVTELQEPVAAN